jgi:hypothetical protein
MQRAMEDVDIQTPKMCEYEVRYTQVIEGNGVNHLYRDRLNTPCIKQF